MGVKRRRQSLPNSATSSSIAKAAAAPSSSASAQGPPKKLSTIGQPKGIAGGWRCRRYTDCRSDAHGA
jgi:hypothetical protein